MCLGSLNWINRVLKNLTTDTEYQKIIMNKKIRF